jgi:hypothetical protein
MFLLRARSQLSNLCAAQLFQAIASRLGRS